MKQAVDVIIPTYNGLPYLKQAIQSVLSQTHDNLLLYVIDDGSTDKGATKKFVKSLKDPRVKYIHKENGGQASARNYGIKESAAEFVTFLDADDIWRPNKLAEQLKLFDKKPQLGMVYGLHKLIDSDGTVVDEVVHQKRGQIFKYLLKGNKISGSGSMVMIRRDVFNKVGLFREDFLIGEDWEMWLRIARSYEIDYVPGFIADLRVLDSGMQQNYHKMATGLEYMLPIMLEEFKLSKSDQATLTGACLAQAALMYFYDGNRQRAKQLAWQVVWQKPSALFTGNYRTWWAYFKILLAPNWLRIIRRTLSRNYRVRETTATQPLISVVLPAYNAEKFLDAAIKSILEQTYTNFELIIINDGSTDKSLSIINKYADQDNRIKVLNQKNKGLVESLNRGIQFAKGRYIARMDADDISLPERFVKQVNYLETHPNCDVLGGQTILIDKDDKPLSTVIYKPVSAKDIHWLLGYGSMLAHPTVFMRKHILGSGYEQSAWPAEDYELWQRLFKNNNVANLPDILLKYRVLSAGISQSNSPAQLNLTARFSKKYRSEKLSSFWATSPLTAWRAISRIKKTRSQLTSYDITDYYFGLYDLCLSDEPRKLKRLILKINIRLSGAILRRARNG